MIKQSTPLSKKTDLVTEPVLAIKNIIRLKPNEKASLNLILSVNEDENEAFENLKKYQVYENSERVFELSRAKIEAESRYLQIKGKDIEIYQKMLSYMLFDNPIRKLKINQVPKHTYYQRELWKYGVSGDCPIILIRIKDINDVYVIKQILKAYEFFRLKNIKTEVVILNEEKYSYENYLAEEIEQVLFDLQISYLKNISGGIFIIQQSEISKNDVNLLNFVASLNIDASKGNLETIINDIEKEYFENGYKLIGEDEKSVSNVQTNNTNIDILENTEKSKYFNEYGTFSEDGKEYLIRTNKQNKLPTVWSHVIANKNFGTIVTENMGGYTWYKNSRLNRLTVWNNSASLDIPSEIIYLKDLDSKKIWSLGANPMPDEEPYNVIYGFGYAKYIHSSSGIEQTSEIFVPQNDSAKINIVTLKNTMPSRRKIKLVYYIKPVLAEDEIKSDEYINLNYEENNNIIYAKNLYNKESLESIAYVSCSEKIKSYTGDKEFFLGEGALTNPDGMHKVTLNNDKGLGKKNCIAIEIEVELESFESKEISLIFGAEENLIDSKKTAYKYSNVSNCKFELDRLKNYWRNLLGNVEVNTPVESINIMLNGWAMYQTISSRLWGRSGFYQSGGAFGFRDQLQDSLATKYLDVQMLKNQIIEHSKHQFIEGDVEHWWHNETGKGIRTKFSDDLLWLAFSVIQYIDFTGDKSILDIETNYLAGRVLEEHEEEVYDMYMPSENKESIYNHCKKAIEKAFNFGENNLPKIGTGDWNDGFSEVGNKGKGESIWLGFFLYYILDKFLPICREKGENEVADKYTKVKDMLKKSLNSNGWDGRWYKRAYTDDGDILGSIENEECKIDSIAQTWSVISGAGDNDKKYICMESLENHLIDRENGIIKLLDPPFEKSKLEPGYIKAYLPGVRENGGQYTHAAIWVVIAEAMLGFGEKAIELYKMINPIEHSRSKDSANKYKVEPYVIAADVYGAKNLAGRGGWTWYTGSSSWYYKAGIEYILGLKIRENILSIEPCIPKDWKEYFIRYKYGESIYNIKVTNPNGKN